jgi:sterol desaturase/sphingolipid hydroxylase (fatty acid hydroxylase superfamily)
VAFAMSVARAFLWLVVLTLIFVPAERLLALHPRKFLSRALVQDLTYYFISSLVPAMLMSFPLALAAAAGHALVPWHVQVAVAAWPVWLRVLAGVAIGEFGFYWGHRLTHEIPFLWRFHSIHHSPERLYFLLSARAHPFDNVFTRLCGLMPIYVLGVASPLTPQGGLVAALIVLVMTVWGFFIHSNLRMRLGPLEWMLATPAFHHWHHTREDHKDRNYAANLPVVDWLFGTFYLPDKWPESYGTDTPVDASMAGQLLDPLTLGPVGPVQRSTTTD